MGADGKTRLEGTGTGNNSSHANANTEITNQRSDETPSPTEVVIMRPPSTSALQMSPLQEHVMA